MELTFKDSTNEMYEGNGKIGGIVKCDGTNNKYYVVLREKGKKAKKSNKTRCDYNTALNIVKEYIG